MLQPGDCVLVPWTQGPPKMLRMRAMVLGEALSTTPPFVGMSSSPRHYYVYLLSRNRWPQALWSRDQIVILAETALMPEGMCRSSEIDRVARKLPGFVTPHISDGDKQAWLVVLDDLLERREQRVPRKGRYKT